MNNLNGIELLETLVNCAHYLKNIYQTDAIVGVTDRKKYLAYYPGETLDLGIKVGSEVKPGSAIHTAMKNKEKISYEIPKDVWGIAAKAVASPVFDEHGDVVGGIAVVFSIENQSKFQEIITEFASAFEQVTSSMQDISDGSQKLAKESEGLSHSSNDTKEKLKKTDEITQMISSVSNQTNMLGLNAAIEAARAGEAGRGFSVVADEIRRLSDQTSSSAKNVKSQIQDITNSINSMVSSIHEISSVSEETSASIQEIAATMEELAAQLSVLEDFAKSL